MLMKPLTRKIFVAAFFVVLCEYLFYSKIHINLSRTRNNLFPTEQLSQLIPQVRVKSISCAKLFQNDSSEQSRALKLVNYRGPTLPETAYSIPSCERFVHERGYITSSLTLEEKEFSIAYSIIVYKDLGQVERLLRAIYRPQNAYCFHVDKKSTKKFREGLKRIVSCFPNVIMSSRSVDVIWGSWTNLECDLICMQDLVQRFPNWKYLINLTGQEFPLRTNLELVRILKAFNGSNNIENTIGGIPPNRIPKEKPNFELTWFKGGVHIAAVRGFVEFIFKSKKAQTILSKLRGAPNPDETFFSTLSHNPQIGAPGAFLGKQMTDYNVYKFIVKLRNWDSGVSHFPCLSGRRVRQLCIWGVRDLPFLDVRPELFVNKFYWNFQPLALDCMEERLLNNTLRDFKGVDSPLNLDFYRNLIFVKNHQ